MATERFTLDQYLTLERKAEGKSEYHSGQIYAVSGGTETHARLSFRIAHLLEVYLNGKCRVYGSDLKIYTLFPASEWHVDSRDVRQSGAHRYASWVIHNYSGF